MCAAKLRERYGKDHVLEHGPIPEPLLGGMWAQDWSAIFDLVVPFKGQCRRSTSVKMLVAAPKMDAKAMVKMGRASSRRSASIRSPPRSGAPLQFTRCLRDREVVSSRERLGRWLERRSPREDVHRAHQRSNVVSDPPRSSVTISISRNTRSSRSS